MTAGRHPFRFGVIGAGAGSRDEWVRRAYHAENLGYATLLLGDHFGEQLAPVPALAAAAEATVSLRIGGYVFDNDYRHPVVLAKEAATLDLLSDGRFELGLGAGWLRADYQRAGIPLDPPATRVERLEETVQIVKALFAAGPATFTGKHYTITALEGQPKPLQRPGPPLMIAGARQRLLALAARHADIVAFATAAGPDGIDYADATAESFARKIAWVREAAGDRFPALELQADIRLVQFTDDRRAAAERLAGDFGLTPDEMLDSPRMLIGTADEMVEALRERRERFGLSYLALPGDDLERFAPVVARLAGT